MKNIIEMIHEDSLSRTTSVRMAREIDRNVSYQWGPGNTTLLFFSSEELATQFYSAMSAIAVHSVHTPQTEDDLNRTMSDTP